MDLLTINQVLNRFPDEKSCIAELEKIRWNGIVTSPFSENSKVYYCHNGKYKCRDSGKYFNVKTNTIFHNSRIGLQKWFIAIWIMSVEKEAITSVELAKILGLTQKTTWYMMQRIRQYYHLRKSKVSRKKSFKPELMDIAPDDKLKMSEWLNMLKK